MTTVDLSTPRVVATPSVVRLVFIGRSLRHSLRTPDALMMAIAMPVILMLLFVFVFGGALDERGNYVNYVVPGLILLCAGFGASSTAVGVATDLSTGIIERFRTMPVNAAMVLTGHVVASLARNLVATGVVIGAALVLGFRSAAGPLEWLGAVAMVTLWILAITWLFAAIGLAASSADGANNFSFVVLFLPYLSSAFVPTATMPAGLRWFADHQPITPIIETVRALLAGTDPGRQPLWAVGWCVLFIAASMIWARWLFARRSARRA